MRLVAERFRIAKGSCPGLILGLVVAVAIGGCEGGSTSDAPPVSLEGAWTGEGEFRAAAGSKEVEAQLELLSSGTYRFLILKPALLALTGVEQGSWARDHSALVLTPAAPSAEHASRQSGSVFRQLRESGGGATRLPKTLVVADDLRGLRLDDGKLSLTFVRDPQATQKLRASGEVRASY